MNLTGKALSDFYEWLGGKISTNTYMVYHTDITRTALVLAWLETVGIYIDRRLTENTCVIWDYRENEPSEEIIVDCTYCEYPNHWWLDSIEIANKMYNNPTNI